jgi:UDP-glucose 4-epimerase
MTRILVTGANGFLGRVLCETLTLSGHDVRAAVRARANDDLACADVVEIGDLGANTDWTRALDGIDTVIHAAARAHILHDSAANAALYFGTNTEGTRGLIDAMARGGVGRLVYVSSIKVNGEVTTAAPFRADDTPAPLDDYGRSKLAAERLVLEAVSAGRVDGLIVRPPLVYGSGVRANFLRLMTWIWKGAPLPLGSVRNSRSLVSVWNLADLIMRLATVKDPGARVFLASDDDDVSTPDLIRKLAAAMGRPARLIPVPPAALQIAARLAGKGAELSRLCGSLRIDVSPTRRQLAWTPPLSVDEGLARTARWFNSEVSRER